MPQKPYDNKEYIDWLDGTDFEGQTEDIGGGNRATRPTKMHIRDFAFLMSGVMDGAVARVEYSPDFMEGVKESDLVMANMQWFYRDDGEFTVPANANVWENVDGAEGWFRIHFSNIQPTTNPVVKTRPRVEKAI